MALNFTAQFFRKTIVALLLSSSAVLGAQDQAFKTPATTSSQVQQESKKLPPRLRNLVFNGVIKLRGEVTLSFFDPEMQKSHWIKLNETVEGITVDSFDLKSQSVRVSIGGFNRFIYLAKAEIAQMPKQEAKGNPNYVPTETPDLRDEKTKAQEAAAEEMVGFDLAVSYELKRQRREELDEEARLKEIQRDALRDKRQNAESD